MVGLHIPLYPAGSRGRAVGVKALLLAAGEVPHGQEGHCHGPHRVPLQPDGSILPMAEAWLDVDIFVGHVDPSGEGHLAVDDHILSMVPVVLAQGEQGHQPIEHPAVDAHLLQLGRIVGR